MKVVRARVARSHLTRTPGEDPVPPSKPAPRNLALAFLVGWPNLRAAEQLVRRHGDELDGRDYGRLRPAAEALAGKCPAAATLLYRALAEDVLQRASSRQYQYAARDVRSAEGLAPFTPAEDGLEPHDAFLARLKRDHGRKAAFWCKSDGLFRLICTTRVGSP